LPKNFLQPSGALLVCFTRATLCKNRGAVELTSARPLWQVNGGSIFGWHAMFNLKMVLRCNGQVLTESWLYQWTPPPVDQRRV